MKELGQLWRKCESKAKAKQKHKVKEAEHSEGGNIELTKE